MTAPYSHHSTVASIASTRVSSSFCVFVAFIALYTDIAGTTQADIAQTLRTHIVKAGGLVDCVEITSVMGVRGVRATCDTEAGHTLMFAPAHIMLSTLTTDQQVWDQVVPDSYTLFLVKRGKDPAAAAVMLALILLRELALGSRSLFAAHIASLPADPPNILALGDDLQMKALSLVVPDAWTRRNHMLKGVSDHVSKAPGMFGNASEADQRRAISYVLSRARAYQSKHLTSLVMVPFQDLPNHDEKPNCEEICDDAGCKFVTLRDIMHGEQISHSYGAKSDLNLLYTYGFMSSNNHSALRISISASKDAVVACGIHIKLDKTSPLALEPEVSKCFQEFEGFPRFLKAVFTACNDLMGHLTGNLKVYEVLEQLGARPAAHALDAALDKALRGELSTLQRCISESRETLKSVAPEFDVEPKNPKPDGDRDLNTNLATVWQILDERTIKVRVIGMAGRSVRVLRLANVAPLQRGSMNEDEYLEKLAAAKKAVESLIANEVITWRKVTTAGAVVVADVWTMIGSKHINRHLQTLNELAPVEEGAAAKVDVQEL